MPSGWRLLGTHRNCVSETHGQDKLQLPEASAVSSGSGSSEGPPGGGAAAANRGVSGPILGWAFWGLSIIQRIKTIDGNSAKWGGVCVDLKIF